LGTVSYNKLVRGKIPQIIEETGKIAVIETLDNEKYKECLDNKLEEELREYYASDNVEELADLVEVLYAILKYKGIDINDFESIRKKKVNERGAFDKRLLLKQVIEK